MTVNIRGPYWWYSTLNGGTSHFLSPHWFVYGHLSPARGGQILLCLYLTKWKDCKCLPHNLTRKLKTIFPIFTSFISFLHHLLWAITYLLWIFLYTSAWTLFFSEIFCCGQNGNHTGALCSDAPASIISWTSAVDSIKMLSNLSCHC